jgi:3-methyladenine DNA glycosylase AlkC
MSSISPERLTKLEQGLATTANLMEGLAIDQTALLRQCFPDITLAAHAGTLPLTQRMQYIARTLLDHAGNDALPALINHPSDTVRGWACYVVSLHATDIIHALELIRPLAEDAHWGVREWAWIAVRPHLTLQLEVGLEKLQPWIEASSERIRRYASEITRPRGVWCKHLQPLKEEPWLALPLLEPLKDDPSRYVQLSVGNWLNDASKSQPEWVKSICEEWLDTSPTKATQHICKRGLRSLNKK